MVYSPIFAHPRKCRVMPLGVVASAGVDIASVELEGWRIDGAMSSDATLSSVH
jgi:hypothetical protein